MPTAHQNKTKVRNMLQGGKGGAEAEPRTHRIDGAVLTRLGAELDRAQAVLDIADTPVFRAAIHVTKDDIAALRGLLKWMERSPTDATSYLTAAVPK